MVSEKEIDSILKLDAERMVWLQADYDPITGKDAPCFEKRVRLHIPDFAIPEQYVPESMMKNAFVHELVKCKTVKRLLEKHPNDPRIRTPHDVELLLRRLRHKYDHVFWLYFCIHIDAKLGGRVRFKLNRAQIETFKLCEELRLAGVPINIVIDKARQWGGSTFCLFYQLWLTIHWDPYHSFVVAAHVEQASINIITMFTNALNEYPAWDLGLPEGEKVMLAPLNGSKNAKVIKDSKGNQVLPAVIYIGTAQSPDSLRSSNIAGIHFSEVGVWPDTPKMRPSKLVAGIQGGLTKKRKLTMQVMESTATYIDDFFHTNYKNAKAGKSTFRALFIPWFYIPFDTLPIQDKREFAKWLLENKDGDQPEGKWRMPGKYYWSLWKMGATLEGIQWYRYTEIDKTTRTEMENEAPSTDVESFQSAGAKVFDIYDVLALAEGCREPAHVGELISDGRSGKEVLDNITFLERKNGPLRIWEYPDDSPISNRYVVAVDIGGPNSTSDFSVIRVMDRFMMMEEFGGQGKPSVVAEMHYHTDHDLLAFDAVRIAKWYNNALLVIESNTLETQDKERDTGGDGSQYILDIVSEIYPNLYAREGKPEDIVEGKSTKWGFHTNVQTKPQIIDNMKRCLREKLWDEPSELCTDEMAMYMDDHGKFTAPPSRHDDVLMATAILLFVSFRQMPLPKWKKENTSSTIKTKTNTIATF